MAKGFKDRRDVEERAVVPVPVQPRWSCVISSNCLCHRYSTKCGALAAKRYMTMTDFQGRTGPPRNFRGVENRPIWRFDNHPNPQRADSLDSCHCHVLQPVIVCLTVPKPYSTVLCSSVHTQHSFHIASTLSQSVCRIFYNFYRKNTVCVSFL